mmetsp:Transcript_22195/g.32844  ORF Transcript_22195/g.32844 Transcript_22195/m.32844 type:complete len:305 (+) Transcript_22195:30-944(+)
MKRSPVDPSEQCSSCIEVSNNANVIVQRINYLHRTTEVTHDTHKHTHGKDSMRTENAMHVHDTQEPKLSSSTDYNEKDPMTDIVINGFHPQLCAWHKNQSMLDNTTSTEKMEIEQEICDTIITCRREKNEIVRDYVNTKKMARPKKERRYSDETPIRDIYRDMFENSNVAQVIATPGGRFGAWNKEFLKVCAFAPTGPYASLTIFDLVLPSALPLLHQIFLTSLYAQFPQSVDSESAKQEQQYLALTVPCIEFNQSRVSYYITLSLMYDSDPSKRCFHCIISSTPRGKIGEVYHIEQDHLMNML